MLDRPLRPGAAQDSQEVQAEQSRHDAHIQFADQRYFSWVCLRNRTAVIGTSRERIGSAVFVESPNVVHMKWHILLQV